jgi:hypothetical protein
LESISGSRQGYARSCRLRKLWHWHTFTELSFGEGSRWRAQPVAGNHRHKLRTLLSIIKQVHAALKPGSHYCHYSNSTTPRRFCSKTVDAGRRHEERAESPRPHGDPLASDTADLFFNHRQFNLSCGSRPRCVERANSTVATCCIGHTQNKAFISVRHWMVDFHFISNSAYIKSPR